ncbi:MAG: ATP phosphoribosyltransferase regulatory subunit [Alphaproteobacteria bacterium]|nr:ATP phosphoribosyltransferase regulatory subunit [Alphaproteobacteria bacterium]
MTKIPPGLLPEGLSDRLPPQAEASARLVRHVLDTVSSHGYQRVMPPLAEFEHNLVARLQSARAQDLLRVVDPVSQRMLALRPDMTAQVGRIAATRLATAARPLRLCYAGPVIKLRANQLRPEREMMQVGAELIGTDSVAAAVEIVNVAIEALEVAGVSDITVDFTLPDLINTLAQEEFPLTSDEIPLVRAALDAKDAGTLTALGAGPAAYLPLIEATGPFHAAMNRLEALDASGALRNRIAGLRAIAKPIHDDITLTLDPTERHGFEYQTWFGFSLFAGGFVGEIGRGGTYMIAHPDGTLEPAIGFSLYPDPLIDAGLGGKDSAQLFLPMGHDPARAAELRKAGWRTIAALSGSDDAATLGCSHSLNGDTPVELGN